MRRPRLAFFTPLNPQRGGVSDHSEELLPALARYADVDIVIDPTYQPTTEKIFGNFRIIGPREFTERIDSYDVPIYQLGNNYRQHGYMLSCMRYAPGIIVLQDYCLQYLMLPLTVGRGDLGALERVLRVDYGEQAKSLARRLLFSTIDPNGLSFAGPLLRSCRGVIVHSRYLEGVVRRDHPSVPLRNVTMGVTIGEQLSPSDLRPTYGYQDSDFILATLSTLVPKKRLLLLLEAVRDLRKRFPGLKLLVVGGGSLGADARSYIDHQGLTDSVRVTGWVPERDYGELTALSDVVVDVRETGAGETANSLLRALAAGKPGIVSASGVFLELPDETCVKIDIDNGGIGALTGAVTALYEDRPRLAKMSRAARDYACSHLRLDQMAEEYIDFVSEVISRPAPEGRDVLGLADSPRRVSRFAVALAYRVFRLGYLYRNYGLIDTLRRVRRELSNET